MYEFCLDAARWRLMSCFFKTGQTVITLLLIVSIEQVSQWARMKRTLLIKVKVKEDI